jgi:hypothetical protein
VQQGESEVGGRGTLSVDQGWERQGGAQRSTLAYPKPRKMYKDTVAHAVHLRGQTAASMVYLLRRRLDAGKVGCLVQAGISKAECIAGCGC